MDKKFSLTRRNFVKGSATVAGGVMVGGLSLDSSAHPAGSDTIKVALVGCGGRGTGAAVQALSVKQNVQLVAMADAFKDRLDTSYSNILEQITDKERVKVKDKNKFVGFDGYKAAIDMADVVILTTPPGFRPIHLEYAVKNDKHVFTEKPMATDAPGIRKVLEMVELSKQKKLNVIVGLQRHYQTYYREMIKRIHDGEIGDITSAQAYWNGGGVWVNPRETGQTEMEYQMRNWYYFNWLCGDHIVEQHIHNLDVINWVKQAYPVKAQGMGGRQVRTGKEYGEIFDHHFVEFEYADGTIMNSQCRHIQNTWNKVAESVAGTKGRADSSGTLYDLKGNIIWKHRDREDPNPYQQEHDELFAAIEAGEVINDLENGTKSTMTAIMGRMATYSGQMITWDEAINSDNKLVPDTFGWDVLPPVLPDEKGFYPIPMPGITKVL
ncbi:MAG: Gfo/Idh/MocA family oxidoreductase [Cyclobacteriaceae bacterium]|nr:Gfo/Idh/MocA family oxidoreductase [Cyclobacteriaceae bacterium]